MREKSNALSRYTSTASALQSHNDDGITCRAIFFWRINQAKLRGAGAQAEELLLSVLKEFNIHRATEARGEMEMGGDWKGDPIWQWICFQMRWLKHSRHPLIHLNMFNFWFLDGFFSSFDTGQILCDLPHVNSNISIKNGIPHYRHHLWFTISHA